MSSESTRPATKSLPLSRNKSYEQGHLAAGFGRVWVLTGDGSELVGIDAETNQATAPIPLAARGTDLAVDDTSVWVVSGVDGQLLRIDPATNQVIGRRDDLDGPRVVDTTGGLWVGDGSSTLRIYPETLETITTIPFGPGRDGDVALGPSGLWIRTADPFLRRVDPDNGALLETIGADVTSPGDTLVAFGALWTSAYNDAALFRLPLSDQ